MSLCADPPACILPASGGSSVHQLFNGTTEKMVFKVKSSNNNDYRITPVFGFIEPLKSVEINIVRNPGPPREDKLVVQFLVADPSATDPQVAFVARMHSGTITIPLTANPAPP